MLVMRTAACNGWGGDGDSFLCLARLSSFFDDPPCLQVLYNANKTMEIAIAERDAAMKENSQFRGQMQGMERKVEQAAQLLTDAAQWNKSLQMEVNRLKKAQAEASLSNRRLASESPGARTPPLHTAQRDVPRQDTSYIIQPSPFERGIGAVQRLDTLLNKSVSEFSRSGTMDINIPSPAGGFPEGMLHSTGGASTLQYF